LGSRIIVHKNFILGAIGNWARGKSFSRKTFAVSWELGSTQKFLLRPNFCVDWELGIGFLLIYDKGRT
jgi:hypothetical protein